jgi:hypothetical protein
VNPHKLLGAAQTVFVPPTDSSLALSRRLGLTTGMPLRPVKDCVADQSVCASASHNSSVRKVRLSTIVERSCRNDALGIRWSCLALTNLHSWSPSAVEVLRACYCWHMKAKDSG